MSMDGIRFAATLGRLISLPGAPIDTTGIIGISRIPGISGNTGKSGFLVVLLELVALMV